MIVSIILTILLSTALFLLIAMCNNNLYCMVFERKDRKLWKKFIREYQNFDRVSPIDRNLKLFFSKDNKYYIWIWCNGLCSVFDEHGECLLCDFDKKMSKKMADKLNSL